LKIAEEGGNLHATGESVSGSRIDQPASLLVLVVLVNVDRQHGTKDLVDHGDGFRILGENDGRLDVESSRVVSRSSENDLSSGFLRFRDV
jgi:hypothetical protein